MQLRVQESFTLFILSRLLIDVGSGKRAQYLRIFIPVKFYPTCQKGFQSNVYRSLNAATRPLPVVSASLNTTTLHRHHKSKRSIYFFISAARYFALKQGTAFSPGGLQCFTRLRHPCVFTLLHFFGLICSPPLSCERLML